MSRTIRKDRTGKRYKESLKKKEARYKCRCGYCTGVDRNNLCQKIADKELKEQLKIDEYNFDKEGKYIDEQKEDKRRVFKGAL